MMTNGLQQRLLFILTLLLFIRGHQGFFIKHSSSGLCLQSAAIYRAKGDHDNSNLNYRWGPIYVVHFYNTCLHPDAQFRFFEQFSVLHNIGKGGTFLARYPADYKQQKYEKRFHIYHVPNPPAKGQFIYKKAFTLKQTEKGALKLYNGLCPTPVKPGTNPKRPFIPQNGDEVYQTTSCDKEDQKFIFGQVTKEGNKTTDVSCSPSQVMKVVMAEYGGFSDGKIFVHQNDADCTLPSACVVKSQCDNKISCDITVNNILFKNDECPGKAKLLYMEYLCVNSLIKPPITKVDDVRLSNDGLPNQGFVEVLENSVWKKVDDQNMKRTVMAKDLCKYLGYSNRDGEVGLKSINSGVQLLSGDLYCRENSSCCARLNSSTSDINTQLPFVTCEICSGALNLSDTSKFPDSNFKTSPSSNGYEARITSSGWCFGKDKAAYLQIDLTLDYVITQIATFGNKDWTKWMTSYTLKYSKDEKTINSDGEIKVPKANVNGFDVAIQNFSNVFARVLKIIPDGEAECMRIELCGHRLRLPGPPENLKTVKILSHSVNISWKAPLIKGDGLISYIITGQKGFSTEFKQTQLEKNLTGLKPYTTYKVKVLSTNSYKKNESAYKNLTFKTAEAAPDGPPLDVVFYSKSKTSLTLSWKPPGKDVRNGIVNKYKVCYSTKGSGERCKDGISTTSYSIMNLQSATKYYVRVSAGTIAGYGVYSKEYSNITNNGPLTPTKKTYFSLSLSLKKPEMNIKSILVIVQAGTNGKKTSDLYASNEVKPFSAGSSDPYVTAGFKHNNLPTTFVIGNGNSYTFGGENYVNQPLKEKTTYILFVMYIESEKMYYSTEWCDGVTTYARPPAPSFLMAISLSSNSLNISWGETTLKDGEIVLFNIFYKGQSEKQIRLLEKQAGNSSSTIDDLKPSTLYEISICSETTIGDSLCRNMSKITNDEPPKRPQRTLSGFYLKLPNSTQSVKTVHIIVKNGRNSQKLPDEYLSKDLQPYDDANPSHPYITTVVENFKDFSKTFEVGNGAWKNVSSGKYYNKPLKQNKTYIVFVRLFINSTYYYSTDWTKPITIIPRPPAPVNIIIVSSGKNDLKISWEQRNLPSNQKVIKHIITYRTGNENMTKKIPKDKVYILNGLQYDKKYFVSVQTITNIAGISEPSKEEPITTNSEPLPLPKVDDNGDYTVSLKKPIKEEVTEVKLVVLQLKSNDIDPDPAEKIKIETFTSSNVDKDYAFAVSFDVDKFNDGNINVVLQLAKKQRRRRAADLNKFEALQLNKTYRVSQRNYDPNGRFSASYWSEPFNTPHKDEGKDETKPGESEGPGSNGSVVIGVTISLVIILLLVIVGAIFWRRRRSNENHDRKIVYDKAEDQVSSFANGLDNNDGETQNGNRHDEDIYSNETVVTSKQAHPPVPISEFAHYVNEMKEKDNGEFNKEFEGLPTTPEASWDVSKKPDNKKRNRYGNIVTYDHSRVILSGDEDNDYINASFIDGIKSNSYIACQGPTKVTLSDMWRMVWEQNSYTIVMVTSLKELGKPKCEQYWPDKGSEMYDDIQVTLTKTEKFAYFITHSLQIKKDGEEREVKHYYFSSWPDHGVPKYPTPLLAFRKHIRANHFEQSGPIIVHCSAGVGRTGVFLAIDMSLQKLEKGTTDTVDVYGQVVEMRGRRMNMIQTLEQYIFVHDAILETILCGMNEVNSSNIKQEIKKLSEVQAGGMTGFQEKFKRLGEISPTFSDEECSAGLLEGNETRNRSKSIYPAECNRVGLQYIYGVEDSDYINAVFVHGFLGKNYFIATQSPLPNTVDDFWRLVHEQKSSVIVLLNNVKDGTSFPKFWPSARAEPKQYGSVTVQLESATEKEGIVTRKFLFSPYPDLHDAHVVKIFHYTKWQDHQTPETADGVIKLMSLVEKTRQSSGEAPVIVACSNGAGRTGTYIAISNLLERMKLEQTVDVFQSIKIIRSSRPQFVENAVQFKFCYEVVSSYLDSFGEYANFEC